MSDEKLTRFQSDSPDTPTIVVVGVVGAILTFVLVVLLQALFLRASEREFENKVVRRTPEELQAVRAEQLERITRYRWVDSSRGVVRIPVERAMELMAAEAASGKNAAGPGAEGAP